MSTTTSPAAITLRLSPRGARELIDDIDLLLDHLGRATPGRLEACFDDSRGTTARGAGFADPPRVRAADGTELPSTKAAFVRRLADIVLCASQTAAPSGADRDTVWPSFAEDVTFLIQSRDFLATLAQPATVDTVRLTRAYVDETMRRRSGRLGWRRRTAASSRAVDLDDVPRNHSEIGWTLATRMQNLRNWCFVCVLGTLALSLYAFGGKLMLDEQARTQTALGQLVEEIRKAAEPNTPGAPTPQVSVVDQKQQLIADSFATMGVRAANAAWCDEPYLDDEGVVRYRNLRQEALCNQLWGINRQSNQLQRHLQQWSAPFVYSPAGWLFGVTNLSDSMPRYIVEFIAPASAEASRREDRAGGAVRSFPENARFAGFREGMALAAERAIARNSVQVRLDQIGNMPGPVVSPPPAGQATPAGKEEASPVQVQVDPEPQVTAPPQPPARPGPAVPQAAPPRTNALRVSLPDVDEIISQSRISFRQLGYLQPRQVSGAETPTKARAIIEGIGLYVMPCLYALLGAFVAVFRSIAQKSDLAVLARSDHERATMTLTLGVVFGAVIGLIADMMKGGAPGSPGAGDSSQIVLGVSALALLAGYSVGHVFRLLDAFCDRVFGARDAAAR